MDLLGRRFGAAAPNRRWVADIAYVMTLSGGVYTAFIMDLYSRRIVGWQVADNLLPISLSMRLKWRSGNAVTMILAAWCIILIGVSSIPRFVIRNGLGKRRRFARSAVREILMIMLLRNR